MIDYVTERLGPRLLVTDPSDRFLYVANAASDVISGYALDPATGALSPLEGSPFPTGPHPRNVTAHPGGELVYVSNWQGASLSGYRILDSGRLEEIDGSPFATGPNPRNIRFDASGSVGITGNAGSDDILSFRVDLATGLLTSRTRVAHGVGPAAEIGHDRPGGTLRTGGS